MQSIRICTTPGLGVMDALASWKRGAEDELVHEQSVQQR